MNLLRYFVCATGLYLLQYSIIVGQPLEIWEANKEHYPDEQSIMLENKLTVHIDLKDDEPIAWAVEKTDILLLKEPRTSFFTQSIYGSSLNEVSQIQAYTLVPRRNNYRRVQVSRKDKRFQRDEHIFYDDSYFISMEFEDVQKKGRMQLEYRRDFFHPAFLPGKLFVHHRPCRRSVFRWIVHPDIEMEFRVFNDPNDNLEYREYHHNGKKVYEWTARDIEVPLLEYQSPPLRELFPFVGAFIRSYKKTDGAVEQYMGSAEALGKMYEDFYSRAEASPSPEIMQIADRLKKITSEPDELVSLAFYWVQDNIRYIAFEDGLRGLIPFDASAVCEQRYGDCKDMTILLISLLKAADIQAYPAWIGTRDIPQNYSDLPTPVVDNHMIAVYKDQNGEWIFLDPTSNYTSFGLPSAMIQGKEALIRTASGNFKVVQVPFISYTQNSRKGSITASLNGRTLEGVGRVSFKGYPKVNTSYLLDRSDRATMEDYARAILQKGSNRFLLSNLSTENLRNRDLPLELAYHFELRDYAQSFADQIFINLNLDRRFTERSIPGSRVFPVEFSFPECRSLVVDLNVPEGFEVEFLPNGVEIDDHLIKAEVNYKLEDNAIKYRKSVCQKQHRIMPEDFETWNKHLQVLRQEFNEIVVLKEINH